MIVVYGGRTAHTILLGCILLVFFGGSVSGQERPKRLADYYGFLPIEIYKLDDRISGLTVADLDGDRVDDVAVANNGRSRIDLLLSTPGPADEEGISGYGSNKLPSDKRLRIKTLPVNKEVVSLQAGDLNGDGKDDLAYYGTPAELTILYGKGDGTFETPKRISTGEAVESGSALALGDLNRDGRTDMVLMAANELITILQESDGTMGRPVRLPHTAQRPAILKLVDIDGDGGDDIAILADGEEPIHMRFSLPGGRLGPEERFKVDQPRAIAYQNVDGKPGQEVLTLENQSGRARAYTLVDGVANTEDRRGHLLSYALPTGTSRGRNLTVGDLNQDGRADVLATDPSNAQVVVFLQGAVGEGLGSGDTHPSLVGGTIAKIDDFDGDGKNEALILSEQERTIGQSQFTEGRLPFPTAITLPGGDPVGLGAGNVDADAEPELIYVAKEKVDGKDRYSLRAMNAGKDGAWSPVKWGDEDAVVVDGLTGTPEAVIATDVNRDGRTDIVILDPYGPPVLLAGQEGVAPPKRSSARPGPLAGVKGPGLTVAKTKEGPALLVAQQSTFARLVGLAEDGQWQVLDQFNSGRNAAQIQAAAMLDFDGNGENEVAMLDRTSRQLLFLDPRDGSYRTGPTLAVGSINFNGMHVADLDGDQRDDLLIGGTDKFGVVLTGGQGRQLESVASYAPSRTDARLADLIGGDVNGDGRMDLVMTDTVEHFLEIAAFEPENRLEPALAFRVFEQKSFSGIDDLIEPREIGLGDVDGDGRTDILLLVHDRVLIYRQDSGQSATASKPEEKTAGENDAEGTDTSR